MTRNEIKKIIGEDAAPEVVDALLDAFHAGAEKEKAEAERLRLENGEFRTQLDAANEAIGRLEKAAPDHEKALKEIAGYKERIAALEKERANDQIRFAAVNAFREAGAHNPEKAVDKFFDFEGARPGKDGGYDGIAEQVRELRKSDPYLFKAEPAPAEKPAYAPRAGERGTPAGGFGKMMADLIMSEGQPQT